MGYGSEFVLTLFTDDPELGRQAERAGVDRIGPDFEIFGKAGRQDASSSWISHHDVARLPDIAASLSKSRLFARINPIHAHSKQEIEFLLQQGVAVLMLPFFQDSDQVRWFVNFVEGRARTVLLLETPQAMARVRDIVAIEGIDEIHIGLNDLHRGLGLRNHFELLVSPVMDMLSDVVKSAGLAFGFGGIGRIDDAALPVAPELVYPQYIRLQADRALLSRVFLRSRYTEGELASEVLKARDYMDHLSRLSWTELEQSRLALERCLADL